MNTHLPPPLLHLPFSPSSFPAVSPATQETVFEEAASWLQKAEASSLGLRKPKKQGID